MTPSADAPSTDSFADLEPVGLLVEVRGAVATVTLHRPDVRNAQTPAMWRALATLPARLPDDVRVVVLRGTGHSFSAGLDRSMLDPSAEPAGGESVAALFALDDQAMSDTIDDYQQGFTWLRDPRFVTIAIVQGYAIGAGFQLALSCDLRLAVEGAQFSMKEVQLGLVPDLTGTKPLVECVGYARALEICATGRMVPADEAERIGLVHRVVAEAEVDGALAELVTALTTPMVGAVRETKALVASAASLPLEEQRLAERTAQVRRFREMAALLGMS